MTQDTQQDNRPILQPDPTLNDLFALLWRGLWLALPLGAALAVATYFISDRLPTVYETQTPLFANQEAQGLPGTAAPVAPLLDAPTYEAALLSVPVRQDVATRLGDPDSLDEVTMSLDGSLAQDSSLLYVTARGPDPTQTSAAADAAAQALVSWDERRTERLIEQTLERLELQLDGLDRRIAELSVGPGDTAQADELRSLRTQLMGNLDLTRTLQGSAESALEVLESAPRPDAPVAPNPLRNAAIAFALGLFLGYGVFLLRRALDTRVRSGADLERLTGLPLLATLPRAQNKFADAAEALYVQLGFATDLTPRTVVLTSVRESVQDKAWVALALAKSFRQEDKRVLLISAADAGTPGDPPASGGDTSLQHYLRHPEAPLKVRRLDIEGTVIDSLPQEPGAEMLTERLRHGWGPLLERLHASYDLVLIDTPPLLTHAYSLVFVAASEATLLFVDAGRDHAKDVSSAVTLLRRSPAPFAGLVARRLDDETVTRSFVGGVYPPHVRRLEDAGSSQPLGSSFD